MNKAIIIETCEKSGMFSQAFDYKEFEKTVLLTVKNKNSALRKTARLFEDRNIIVSNRHKESKIFSEKLKPYNTLSHDAIFPVINKISRQAAEKFGQKLPLEEVFIIAQPLFACQLISFLHEISRLFTIVSPKETLVKMYDELYFKNGTLIRQIPEIRNISKGDSMIICCERGVTCAEHKIPIIDLYDSQPYRENVLHITDISICDDGISEMQRLWSGKSGILLYNLLGIIPSEHAQVDINNTPDRIFLLDTTKV